MTCCFPVTCNENFKTWQCWGSYSQSGCTIDLHSQNFCPFFRSSSSKVNKSQSPTGLFEVQCNTGGIRGRANIILLRMPKSLSHQLLLSSLLFSESLAEVWGQLVSQHGPGAKSAAQDASSPRSYNCSPVTHHSLQYVTTSMKSCITSVVFSLHCLFLKWSNANDKIT